MKNIPLFTAANGLASLVLREIPTRQEAYIWIRSVFGSLDGLLEECQGFCLAAGAQRVYAAGHPDLASFPVYAQLIQRSASLEGLPTTQAVALPAKDEDVWMAHYQERFRDVPAANSQPESKGLYDIFLESRHIGIGQLVGDQLLSLASLERGKGRDCLCALAALSSGPKLHLLCALENTQAMKLYDSLGFAREKCTEVWYRVK